MHQPAQRTSRILRVREAVQGVPHAGKNMVVARGGWKKNPVLRTCRGEVELNSWERAERQETGL